uniref:Zinc finger CCCH domain-containing protein 56 n=1 Tax=Aegilops tauschii TaxID=37682 RepID=N1R467_AEGTA
MDYTNAIHIIPDAAGPESWANSAAPPGGDSGIWATEDDYSQWNGEQGLSGGGYGGDRNSSQPHSRAGSEQPPPGKKPRGSGPSGGGDAGSTSKSRAIGKMFFKTKLCCKFRAGTCPYVTNCNFAHGMEELRKPPPNWQEIVAAHEEATEQREEHQIPIMTSSNVVPGDSVSGRAYKGRHCKKFYTEEGCPYGDACTFLHDEQSKAQLHKYGGGLVDIDGRDIASTPDSKQAAASSKLPVETAAASTAVPPHADVYHLGSQSQRSALASQRSGQLQRPIQKWKGPDKISRIYGDWIDETD